MPLGLKAFLLALAIFDDIGATVVSAVFYGSTLNLGALAVALVLLGIIALMARLRARSVPAYLVMGTAAWLATYESGVHPALVGVAIGPHGLALIADTDDTRDLAEIGVVFLMFSIGLEFSLAKLATLSARKIYTHINNTNPILAPASKERRVVESAGWEIAYDGMEIAT